MSQKGLESRSKRKVWKQKENVRTRRAECFKGLWTYRENGMTEDLPKKKVKSGRALGQNKPKKRWTEGVKELVKQRNRYE